MQYKYNGSFAITGRGQVLTMDLDENNLPRTVETVKGFMGSEIEYEGKKYIVTGVETFMLPMSHPAYARHVGLLIKPKQDESNNRTRDNED